ncbi:UPF0481 protein At3g47200-like [Magnolia sinica]|uniref:UPF0481 protein At3g47200-like n=1 Tax=Magnolia sinica TaxID=86752 RepID=UPI00265AF512|nr:UPF0481 protein At3g47200-like [Magnolia sinica]
MMMLDGCFIAELFLKLKQLKKIQEKMEKVVDGCFNFELSLKLAELCKVDPMFRTIWMLPLIGYDLLLLENQIPFLVMQRIFKMASPVDGSLTKLALDFFKDFLHKNEEILLMDSYHHLLHLLHLHVTPSEESNLPRNPKKRKKLLMFLRSRGFFPNSNRPQLPISNHSSPPLAPKIIPCAADLHLAGVKFKKKEKYSSILDMKFTNGVLEIPPLVIDEYTKSLFGNLIAFEQCYPNAIIHFTTYLSFMECLMDTSKDVALLHRSNVQDPDGNCPCNQPNF